ncbi:Uncharacterised protein [Aeromonas salmonicida]|uniref:hypothetical protein n=1 Tax=Aeromonas salmonicida TaxID=645 RepID=UPI001024D706|nr:hypothetical protein [Aeromonas salmonicida]VFB10105.1 Uncharacterised protein [Aeromonas salmonicida]
MDKLEIFSVLQEIISSLAIYLIVIKRKSQKEVMWVLKASKMKSTSIKKSASAVAPAKAEGCKPSTQMIGITV